MAFIAVAGCTLQLMGGGATLAPLQITEPPNPKILVDNKPAYVGVMFNVVIAGYTGQSITTPNSGAGAAVIKPLQILKVMSNGQGFLGQMDVSMPATITGTMPGPSGPVPAIAMETVQVMMAGQTKVQAM